MSKNFSIIIISLIIIFVGSIIMYTYPFSKSSFSLKTYDFDPRFIFQYPIFYGWETSISKDDDRAEISYNPSFLQGNHTVYEVPPRIILNTVMMKVAADFWDKQRRNPSQVPYYFEATDDNYAHNKLYFRIEENTIEMWIPKVDDKPSTELSGTVIKDQIVKSFATKRKKE